MFVIAPPYRALQGRFCIAALDDETVRPLGDSFIVQSAKIMPYTINATLYVREGPEAKPILQAAQDRLQNHATLRKPSV